VTGAAAASSGSFAFADLLGLELGAASEAPGDSDATVRLVADDRHLNLGGVVHGGVIATMLDTAMGRAVREVTDEKTATSQLTVTYLDPAKPGLLVATARVRKRGSALTVVEAEVEQDGKPVAHSLATFALLKR
jgi:uncharacterized protein (TIGR00369 family)